MWFFMTCVFLYKNIDCCPDENESRMKNFSAQIYDCMPFKIKCGWIQSKIKEYAVKLYIYTGPTGTKNHESVPNEIIRID